MMQTPLDKLRAAMPRPLVSDGQGGGKFRTSCPGPGHKNGNRTNPALAVREKTDGTLLLHCFTGCTTPDVLASIGLKPADLYPVEEREAKPRWNPFRDGRCVATYPYAEGGVERFLKERWEPKRGHPLHGTGVKHFNQKHHNPEHPKARRDGYVPGRNDYPGILWKVDEVHEASAAGKELWLVEGEKDVASANALGIVATCNADGASKGDQKPTWSPEIHCPPLRGAHVVVFCDNDVAGRAHARFAAHSLVGIAASVKLLPPLGKAEKYDLSDYLHDGGTLEELRVIIDDTPLFTLDDEDVDDGEEHEESRPTRPRILIAKSFNAWLEGAATRPRARRVFGDCFYEKEFCIFFGETNTGKTILGVQIAQAAASGRSALLGFATEVGPMTVLYYDFELSDRQSYGRYSDDSGNLFAFHPNFIRAEVSRDFDFEGEWADALSDDIEALIVEHEPGAVFIDNLTAIRDDTEKAKGALPLMRRLNTLKRRYDLSLMALAHTPKRDASKPLSRNDLAGSRNILNLCDSSFAIGESHRDAGTRYLKQIKVRETDFSLDSENVAFLSLDKTGSFLGFNLIEYGSELDHLKARTTAEISELDADILALREREPNLSQREIGRRLTTNHVKVGRVLKRAAEKAEDEAREGGTGGTGGTGVPVYHPSNHSGNGTLPESGTVEQVFQGVPPSGDGGATTVEPDEWDAYPTDGGVL